MILIVDDDVGMSETCAMLLEAHGFKVSVAASGDEALAIVKSQAHDLIISDCVMPGMTGIQLSEQIRAHPPTSTLPVLLMSASLRCDIAQGSTYDGFLRKPFLAENLLAEVRKLLINIAPPVAGHGKA